MTEQIYVKVVVQAMRLGPTEQLTAEGYLEFLGRQIPWDCVVNSKLVRFADGQLEYPNLEKELKTMILTTLGTVNIPAVKTFTVPKR
jgi:hypothetical protein